MSPRSKRLASLALVVAWAGAIGCGGGRPESSGTSSAEPVPPAAHELLAYVRQHGFAPPDHLGGRVFPNYEGRLPRYDGRGKRILYREWDVRPKALGADGGRERLVTGSDGRAWYTGDKGRTFVEVK